MSWVYTDPSNYVVARVLDDGRTESCLASTLDAGVVPDPYHEVVIDWRPAATTALGLLLAHHMQVLTSMQMDYFALGQTTNAQAVLTAKQALKDIANTPAVLAVYNDPNGTHAQYDAAVKAAWGAITAPTPTQVKLDFGRYGGNAAP